MRGERKATCPGCGHRYRIKDNPAPSISFDCKKCGARVQESTASAPTVVEEWGDVDAGEVGESAFPVGSTFPRISA